MKVMLYKEEKGYKTERQWNLAGFAINPGEEGERYWTNGNCQVSAVYFLPEQTHEMSEQEHKDFKESEKAAKKARAEKRKEQERREQEQWEKLMQYHTACQWLAMGYVPKADAVWRLGKKLNPGKNEGYPLGSTYYYCHEKDVVKDEQRAAELARTYEEHFRANPNDWYDGNPWW